MTIAELTQDSIDAVQRTEKQLHTLSGGNVVLIAYKMDEYET